MSQEEDYDLDFLKSALEGDIQDKSVRVISTQKTKTAANYKLEPRLPQERINGPYQLVSNARMSRDDDGVILLHDPRI